MISRESTIMGRLITGAFLLLISTGLFAAPINKALSLKEFLQKAAENDTRFETILIDQLPLKYRHTLLLPDSDIILSIKHQHNFYLDQDRNDPETNLSLEKLFPYSGTQLVLNYNKSSSIVDDDSSSLQLLISQPIARNAFGKGVQLRDKIITIENDIIRYQIIEAYEDYLASLTTTYYNWYSAWENLKVGRGSYRSTEKLLENILERQRQNIALPIDVNKIKLTLAGKRENLILLQEIYDTLSNLVFQAIRHKGENIFVPAKPPSPTDTLHFAQDYEAFVSSSRTYRVLELLEKQGSLEVAKAADDLLPSTNLLLGYQLDGKDWAIRDREESVFAGVELEWPIGRSVDKAKKEVAMIQHYKTILSNKNKYEELHTNLRNIFRQIQREQHLIEVSSKKIQLAEKILKDEAENYSFGKVSLNDYIQAVNDVDENRFRLTEHTVQRNKLLVEWLRLTDKLVDRSILDSPVKLP